MRLRSRTLALSVLESLDVPRYTRVGDTFDTTLFAGSTGAANSSLQVSIDGRSLKDQPVALQPGSTRLTLTLSIDGVGFHRIRVTSGASSVEGFVIAAILRRRFGDTMSV